VFVAWKAGEAILSEMVSLSAGTDLVGQLTRAVRAELSAARGIKPEALLQLQLLEGVAGDPTMETMQAATKLDMGSAGAALASKGVVTGSWLFATLAEPTGA
jgi:hypothetical protein